MGLPSEEKSHSPVDENAPSPYSASSPGGLKFSFAKGKAPTKPELRRPSKLSNGMTAFHVHGDSDSDDETHRSFIRSMGTGEAVGKPRKEKELLVIKPPESHNEHWLQRRLKMFRPDMVDKTPENVDLSSAVDRIGEDKVKVGLQITENPSPRPYPATNDSDAMLVDETPKTEDELALEMLLRQAQNPHESISIVPKLVIPSHPSESDVYAYDMAHLSDAPTLATYERVPVEAFGMGILLGLGWKEGTDLHGQQTESFKELKKRPDFLGIGAQEEEFLRVDKKGKKVSRKDGLGGSWNPLKKIDKRTGEVIIEEEGSRKSTPRERSGVSTPQSHSRYGTPTGGPSGERDRDVRGRSYDRDKRKDTHRSDEGRSLRDDSKDRSYDSDRGKKRDREYDSERDHYRRRRQDGMERSENGSRRESRRPSPQSKRSRSRSPRIDDRSRRQEDGERSGTGSQRGSRRPSPRRERSRSPRKNK
jgi:G-patch domain